MAQARGLSERAYARSIEGAWSRVRGRPVVLSPREFELVSGWRRRGIPLAVVLEVLEDHARKAAVGKGGPRTLAYAGPAVESAWEAVAAGRAVARPAGSGGALGDALAAWRRARAASDSAPLRSLLHGLLAEADGGVPSGLLDAALDAGLPAAAPAAAAREASRAAEEALAPFRARMSPAEYARTLERARADRLREALGLPRLSLSRPASPGGGE